jgi:hypothetical protein
MNSKEVLSKEVAQQGMELTLDAEPGMELTLDAE